MYLDFRGIELHVWCSSGMRIEIWVGLAETFGTHLVARCRTPYPSRLYVSVDIEQEC